MSLRHFFDPHSVAIVGASRAKGKVGYEILSAAISSDYSGSIFAVNPNAVFNLNSFRCLIRSSSIGNLSNDKILIRSSKHLSIE